MSAPVDHRRHCPTCGRGPFFVVRQRVPAGAAFYFIPSPGPDAGGIVPADPTGSPVYLINADADAWQPGHHVEWAIGGWRRIR